MPKPTPGPSRLYTSQDVVQGPYEWQMMDAWLANGFVGEDLSVNRAGTSEWMALRDMVAKREREGPPAPRKGGGAAPPPAPRPVAGTDTSAAAAGKERAREIAEPEKSKRKQTVAVSSRYTESVDARIQRMIAEGKFGPALTRLATGGGKAGDAAADGGPAAGRGSPAHRAGAPGAGAKRKAPSGTDASVLSKKQAATEKTAGVHARPTAGSVSERATRKNEWRHADGYAQLPVFEPAKPVEVPSAKSEEATPDPRKRGKKDFKQTDLPLPAWGVEDAIERRRKASGFDRGGPRPAAEPKADDSDGEGSDVSWSALPGTREPAELLEERRKAKQKAMGAADTELEAAEAAAAARAAAAAAAKAAPPADAAAEAARLEAAELAACALDPSRGEWCVPVPSDGWRWRDNGMDAETLRREMDEAGDLGPRRVVARRGVDDAFKVFGVPGYGEALRGVALDAAARAAAATTRSNETSASSVVSGGGSGFGFVRSTVSAAKRASPSEIGAWFESTTANASPKSPKASAETVAARGDARAALDDAAADDTPPSANDFAAFRASAASLSGASASEWFEAFTEHVAVAAGEARRLTEEERAEAKKSAGEKRAAERTTADATAVSEPVVATMAPSEAQEGACARVMGALHDAVMRQRARVFYELVRDDIKRYA